EPAEPAVGGVEQRTDPPQVGAGGARDGDLAPHRPEPVRHHDWLVVACDGACWGGAIDPAASAFRRTVPMKRLGAASGRTDCLLWPAAVLRVRARPAPNTASASASMPVFAMR